MAFFEKSHGYESKTSYPENLGALQCRGRECRGRVPMVVSGGVMTAWDRHWAGGVLCGDAVWLPRGINAPTHGLPFHITSHHHITSHPITSHHIIWFCCVMLLDIRRLSDRYATAIRWLSDGYPMALIMAFQQTADGNWAAIRRLSDGYPRQTRQPYF